MGWKSQPETKTIPAARTPKGGKPSDAAATVSTDIGGGVTRGTADAIRDVEAELAGAMEGRGTILLERLRGVAKQHKATDDDYAAMIRWASEKARSGEVPEIGDFGPVFRDLAGNWQGAVARLWEVRGGDAVGALNHPAAGPVDVVWGWRGTPEKAFEDGYGFAKIAEKHPEAVKILGDVFSKLPVKERKNNYLVLEDPVHRAVIRLDWNRQEKKWLLTAFEKEKTTASADGIAGVASDADGAPPAPRSSGSTSNIPPSPPGGQPAKPWGPVRGVIEGLIGTTGRSADGMLKQISKRGITAVDELRAMFHPEVGGERVTGETFHEGVQKGIADFMGRLDNTIGGLSRTTADDVARLVRSGEAKGNGPLHRKAQEVRAILDDMHGYLKQAGVDLDSPRAGISESLANSTRSIKLPLKRLSEVAPCAARSSQY